jgi:hypothetical protein
VVTVYEDPPLAQPQPIAVAWAPPPMLVEAPPPAPYPDATWVGGYWVWRGNWVWAHGHWSAPPRPRYYWVNPYYENRGGDVIFVNGYWSAPDVVFVPPPPSLRITLAVVAAGVRPGPPPMGPLGVFVPPPPGSRAGIVVPAPLGTSPAVVTSAPPVVNVGMRIQQNVNVHNTTVVNNVTNVTNVTIVAPASAVASGRAVNAVVPAQAHVAAAMRPVVNVQAPRAASSGRADGTPPMGGRMAPAGASPGMQMDGNGAGRPGMPNAAGFNGQGPQGQSPMAGQMRPADRMNAAPVERSAQSMRADAMRGDRPQPVGDEPRNGGAYAPNGVVQPRRDTAMREPAYTPQHPPGDKGTPVRHDDPNRQKGKEKKPHKDDKREHEERR